MISLIAAYAKNRVIGNNGRIPWKAEGEQKRFKALTTGNAVIMGRRTYEEIGRPLPDRLNIVISTTKSFNGVITVKNLKSALEYAKGTDAFISGGARLYEEILPIVDKMYITEVDLDIEGDTFFPEFDESLFEKEIVKEVKGDISYTYLTYTRKTSVKI